MSGNEAILKIGVDTGQSTQGVVVFNRSLDLVAQSAEKMVSYIDRMDKNLDELAASFRKTGDEAKNTSVKVLSFADRMKQAFQELNKLPDTLADKWRDLATPINQTIEIVNRLRQSFVAMYDMAKRSAEADEAKASFSSLAASMGKDADEILAAVKRATAGQLSVHEIANSASSMMRMGVAKDTNDIAKLFQIAEFKADQTGQQITEVLSQMTSAIGKGMPRLLLSLGLVPDSFAKIRDAEQLVMGQTELLNLVLEQGSEQMAMASGEADSLAFVMGQLEKGITGVNPMVRNLSEGSSSAADTMAAFEKSMEEASLRLGESLIPALEHLIPIIENNVIPLVETLAANLDRLFDTTEDRIDRLYFKQGKAGTRAGMKEDIEKLNAERRQVSETLNKWQDMAGVALGGEDKKQEALEKFRNTIRNIDGEIAHLNNKLGAEDTSRKATAIHRDIASGVTSLMKAYKQATEVVDRYTTTSEKSAEKSKSHRVEKEKELQTLRSAYEKIDRMISEESRPSPNKLVGTFFGAASGVQGIQEIAEDLINPMKQFSKEYGVFIDNIRSDQKTLWDTLIGKGIEMADRFKQNLDEAQKRVESMKKLLEENKDILPVAMSNAAIAMAGGVGQAGAVALTSSQTVTKTTLGVEKAEAKKQGSDFGKVFSKEVADALNTALTDAFKNGNMFEGLTRGITNAIQQAVSQSNPVINAGGGINFGNLGLNLGVSAVMGWLQSPGRLLGGTKINGGEVPGQAEGINQQVSNAIAARNAARLVGASSETIGRLRGWQPAYAGYSWDESGDGLFSAKTKTYQLDATAANAALAEFADLMKKANQEMQDAEMLHLGNQSNANIYALGGNELMAAKIRIQDAEKRLEEIKRSIPVGVAGRSPMTPEQMQQLKDAEYAVGSLTKSFNTLKDTIDNANKSLILRFPGATSASIIANPHMDDILLGVNRPNESLSASDLALRQQILGSDSVYGNTRTRKGSQKAPTTDGNPHPQKPLGDGWVIGTPWPPSQTLPVPDPVVVVPPTSNPTLPPGWQPPRGTPRAPNNGVPMAYAMPGEVLIADESGWLKPQQIESGRRTLTEDEQTYIDAVLKEYAVTKTYTTEQAGRNRFEALNKIEANDFTGRQRRLGSHLLTANDELGTIAKSREEQDAAIKKFSAEGKIEQAQIALERWKQANEAYFNKYNEVTQIQVDQMETSTAQAKYAEGLGKASLQEWQQMGLGMKFLSNNAGMFSSGAIRRGENPLVWENNPSWSGATQEQRAQYVANTQMGMQADAYGYAKTRSVDLDIREMQARASGNTTEIQAVMKARNEEAAERAKRLKEDLRSATQALSNTQQSQEEYLRKYTLFKQTQDAYDQARLDEAQTAIDQQAAMKEKQTAFINDVLATMITRVGENQVNAQGQTVLVLSGGQPDGLALANKIKDSVAGVDPELARVIQDFIEATPNVRWN